MININILILISVVYYVSWYVPSTIAGPLVPYTQIQDDDTEVVIAADDGDSINSLNEGRSTFNGKIDLSYLGSAIYGKPDEIATGSMVSNYSQNTELFNVNPEELGSYVEGDILVPNNGIVMKNGVPTESSRWPGGIVPFEIRGNFDRNSLAIIEHAIREYHARTCIRFVQRTVESDYVSIVSGNSGCWSSVGRIGGRQEVNLQSPGCLSKPGTAIHELMHALGFLHEQNRQERDAFVSIQYGNIQSNAQANFERAADTEAFGVPYDYGSVMHYSANAFSSNGRPTIVPTQGTGGITMGQRNGFSQFDVEKINRMYNCNGVTAGIPSGVPIGTGGGNNNLINSFINGVLTGLGFGDSEN